MAWSTWIRTRVRSRTRRRAGFIGLDTFVYRVLDTTEQVGHGHGADRRACPRVFRRDAVDDAAETPEDTPVSIDVAANDTDVDGDLDPRSVRILVGPLQGSAQVDPATGHIVFTPAADFVGRELLWYEIRDARGQSDIGLVHITVTPVNDPPVAHDDMAIILQDTPTDLYILSNDTDADSRLDPATLRIETNPASGTVAIQADGSVRYTPHTRIHRHGLRSATRSRMTPVHARTWRWSQSPCAAEPTLLVVGRTFEDLDENGPGLEGPGIAGYLIYLLDGQGQLLADDAHANGRSSHARRTRRAGTTSPICHPARTWWPRSAWPAGGRVFRRTRGSQLAEPPVNPGLYVVTLSQSSDIEVLDFGNYRSGEAGYASIAGHVYVDVDNDGICDPQEMGLPNVPITLAGPVTRVVLTDAIGLLPRGGSAGRCVHDHGNTAAGVPGRPGHAGHTRLGHAGERSVRGRGTAAGDGGRGLQLRRVRIEGGVYWQATASGLDATGQRVRGQSASGTGPVAGVSWTRRPQARCVPRPVRKASRRRSSCTTTTGDQCR